MKLSEHHEKVNEKGIGKCSVPMWCDGLPAGFCDDVAYSEQTKDGRGRYPHYVGGLACFGHGGSEYNLFVLFGIDGNKHTCTRRDFINLQESPCGFGDTLQEAYEDLLKQEL